MGPAYTQSLGMVLLQALTALAVVGASGVSPLWVGVVLVVAGVVFAFGWPVLTGTQAATSTAVVIALAGTSGGLLAYFRWDARYMLVALALCVMAAFLAQMLRRDGREGLTDSLALAVTGSVVALAASGWVVVGLSVRGSALVMIMGAALLVASVAFLVPAAAVIVGLVATVLAGGVGVALSYATSAAGLGLGMVLGVLAGISVTVVNVLFADRDPYGPPARLARATMPFLICGASLHVITQVL